ncbi:MAG: UvrD-helicase domain-containing protein, partial [Bryobacteraceae bacterium]
MKRPADFAVRQRALNHEVSFLVQAPAGSGKTELLIQRYLKLLGVATVPEAVIAITFTKKAASEVQGRVIEALQTAATTPEPLEEHERETWLLARGALDRDGKEEWRLRENPSRMRIQTIDALALGIVRRMPWLARFGAVPEISENAKDLYREAARNTLALIGAGGERARAIENLLLHLDCRYQDVEKLLAQMLEKREQWLTAIRPGTGRSDLRGALERTLAGQIERELARVQMPFAAEFGNNAGVPGADDRDSWQQVADWLLTMDGKWRKKRYGPPDFWRGPATVDVMDRLHEREDLRERLCDLRKLPPPQFDDCQWEAMEAALTVLPLAAAELQLAFREHGRVDFAELSIRACNALKDAGEPSDLALALGDKIEHILVDEFQDTSYTQLALLELLTAGWEPGDGRTLFLVGDPMQSIYRFRQAEVGIFLEAREHGIGQICLEPLTLSANFRSGTAIVQWVNKIFDRMLPVVDDAVNGAVRFSPSVPFRDECAATVRMHALVEPDGKNEEAALVLSLLHAGIGNTAILVRARSHLPRIVRILREHGVPFQAVEIDELSGRPAIQDLLALTRALLNPAERIAWLALLRAPWCGLSLEDLHAITGSDQYSTLWDLLHREELRLSADGAARLARVLPALERALAERGRWPLRAWIEQTWVLLGGPPCVHDDHELDDASAFFDLIEGLDEGGSLRDPAELKTRTAELFAKPDPNAPDRLQILTIHKAKGLEWDRVILPGLDAGTRPSDPPLLRWQEVGQGEVLLAVPPAR